jgi:hypothetical protein
VNSFKISPAGHEINAMPKPCARALLSAFIPLCFLALPGIAVAQDGGAESGGFFEGSFIGSMIYGYPYSGIGTADLLALGVIVLLILRAVQRRGPGNTKDMQDDGEPGSYSRPPAANPRPRRANPDKIGEDEDNRDLKASSPNEDKDGNVWSRRLGGLGGRPQDGDPGADEQRTRTNSQAPWRRADAARPARRVRDQAESLWGHLSSKPGASDASGPAGSQTLPEDALDPSLNLPPDFDAADFLEGARTLYIRLQKAWAARDISGLSPFVAPELLTILQKQADANPEPGSVEILMINARLMDVKARGEEQKSKVQFKVLMTTGEGKEASEISELWTFSRSPDSGGMWRLQGIGGD